MMLYWDFKNTKTPLIFSMVSLIKRLKCFGLKVHPAKTKLIRFGLFALKQYAEQPSRGKLGTFYFLGFTHYIGKKYSGEAVVKRKTKRTRQISQSKRVRLELRKRLHDKPWDTGLWLRRVVQGYINYYGVPFNSRSVKQFIEEVKKRWLKSLRRRSQKRRMNWERFIRYIKFWIPRPHIVHPYPEQRFYAKYSR